jgi:hypothetical protein
MSAGSRTTRSRAVRCDPQVAEWRRSQLSRAGFPAALAARAASARLDLHAAIELVERGCPPPLALRILAPE